MDGRIPEVPHGSSVKMEPYSEIYQYSNNRKLLTGGGFTFTTYLKYAFKMSTLLPSHHLLIQPGLRGDLARWFH